MHVCAPVAAPAAKLSENHEADTARREPRQWRVRLGSETLGGRYRTRRPGPGARVMAAELVISNTGAEFLSVKVRTTNPALFHVTPHTACLEPEKSVTIRIRTTASTDLVAFQQFQLSLLQTEARLAPEQLGAVFSAKNSQGRRIVLRCQVEREAVETREGAGEASSVTHALRERVASLEERIHNLYQILALQAVVMIAVVLYKSFSF